MCIYIRQFNINILSLNSFFIIFSKVNLLPQTSSTCNISLWFFQRIDFENFYDSRPCLKPYKFAKYMRLAYKASGIQYQGLHLR